jgi:hypothetical protein
MGSTLFVGRLVTEESPQMVRQFLSETSDLPPDQQSALCNAWSQAPEEVAAIDALNLASIELFLSHTAELEAISVQTAIDASRWRQLPYWIYSHWLPVPTNETRLINDAAACPLFFGSAQALLSNLEEIADQSPLQLRTMPPHFDLMRSDPRTFHAIDLGFDDRTTVQWIWRALFEAATLSVEQNVPMWSA